jgi:NAD(P)-dependent dehydrogenase (short-subunit alcohol dehydrogenase family)
MADAHSKPVWFITGCSTGFGRELSVILLKRGYRVVVTARDKAKVDDIVGAHAKSGLALALDVDKQAQIDAAVKATEARFGRINVLVNNAGYGYLAAIEEGDDSDVRAMFDTNVFGLAAMTRAALPVMRAHRRARPVPHRLGGPLSEDAKKTRRGLRRDRDRTAAPDSEL